MKNIKKLSTLISAFAFFCFPVVWASTHDSEFGVVNSAIKQAKTIDEVRRLAAMAKKGDQKAIKELINLLKSRNRYGRTILTIAAEALAEVGTEEVVKVLTFMLHDNFHINKDVAQAALKKIAIAKKNKKAVEALRKEVLQKVGNDTDHHILAKLHEKHDLEGVKKIRTNFKKLNDVKINIVRSLGEIALGNTIYIGKIAKEALIDVMKSDQVETDIRVIAVGILEEIVKKKNLIETEKVGVFSFSGLEVRKDVKALISALEKDPSEKVRIAILSVLYTIGGEEGKNAIKNASERDPSKNVRDKASRFIVVARVSGMHTLKKNDIHG